MCAFLEEQEEHQRYMNYWPSSSSDLAAWIGSLGTLAAVLWAVWQWRREQRTANDLRREQLEQLFLARKERQWAQAQAIYGQIISAAEHILIIANGMNSEERVPLVREHRSLWMIPEAEEIRDALGDAVTFDSPYAEELMSFLNGCYLHNQNMKRRFDVLGELPETTVAFSQSEVEHVRRLATRAAALRDTIRDIRRPSLVGVGR
jgi:hypothetical protein